MKRFLVVGLVIASATVGRFVIAAEIVNTTAVGIAVDGFDMVAYFKLGYPVKGRTDHSVTYKNAKWLFSTSEY
jgi:hypothetical protein